MGYNTKYGYCLGCDQWVPRDEMLSINVSIYDEKNQEFRIPMRFCPPCHRKKRQELLESKWDNVLKTEAEIRTNLELAERSDLPFDDSEEAMRKVGILSD